MTRSYRASGREHLVKAKELLEAGDNASLIYCALQLRMTIEAHVYETAKSYSDELPEKRLSKWQPGKLLSELLEIDPHVDRTGTLRFARENTDGSPQEWQTVGTLKRMTLKEVEGIYHKLGSYLHVEPVLDHNEGKVRDWNRVRETCTETLARLTDLYSTNLFNLKLGQTSEIECFVCNKTIKRRLNNVKDGETIITQCGGSCVATYSITVKGEKVEWLARYDEMPCQHPGCEGTLHIWERWIKVGNSFRCDVCGKATVLGYTLTPEIEGESPPTPE